MARGGARRGAGRPKGVTSVRTKLAEKAVIRALREGASPLDVLLEAMRDAYATGGATAAMTFAKEAAPYVHPKLSSVDAKVDGVIGQYAAQPIPVESRDSDSVAGSNGSAANGHSAGHG